MTNTEILDAALNELDDNYTLTYADYRDEVSKETLEKCLDKKDIQPYYDEIDEYIMDAEDYSVREIIDGILKGLDLDEEDEDAFRSSEEFDDLRFAILERDDSTTSKDIFTNRDIQGRIVLNSDFEAISEHADNFEYKGGYLRTMIDFFNLNPRLVKEEGVKRGYTFLGRWDDYKWRNGKEVISYEDVFRFIGDCWYYSQLTFVGKFDMEKLFTALCKEDFSGLVIPKGTTFIAFSSWEGFGGEHEFETINDLDIEKANKRSRSKYDSLDLRADEGRKKYGYTTTDVFGGEITTDYLF